MGIINDPDGLGLDRAVFVSNPVITKTALGGQEAIFEVRLSEPSTQTIVVDYRTRDGTALAGEDYEGRVGSLSFAPGQESALVRVPIIDDVVREGTETFFLAINASQAPVANSEGTTGTASILANDNADRPQITIAGSKVEEAQSLQFVVTLTRPALDAVTVEYRTLFNGAADQRVDVREISSSDPLYGTVTLAPGETSKSIFLYASQDSDDEVDQAITVELFDARGADLENGASVLRVTGIVLDQDGPGSDLAAFVSSPVIEEAGPATANAVFEIRLSEPAPGTVFLDYRTVDGTALAGEDYFARSGTVSFVAGQEVAYVRVPILDDGTGERAETFSLVVSQLDGDTTRLTTGSAVPDTAINEINEVQNLDAALGDEYVLVLAGAASGSMLIADSKIAVPPIGSAWAEGTGASPFVLSPNEIGQALSLGIIDGAVVTRDFARQSGIEAIALEASAGKLAQIGFDATQTVLPGLDPTGLVGVATIRDAGELGAPLLNVEAEAAPEGQFVRFTVTRTGLATDAASVSYRTIFDGTASEGTDARQISSSDPLSGTIEFAPGQESASVVIDASTDSEDERDESFTLELFSPQGAAFADGVDTISATGFIRDDDGLGLNIAAAGRPAELREGETHEVLFELSRASLNELTFDVLPIEGTATSADFTLLDNSVTFAPGQRQASVSVRIVAEGVSDGGETFDLALSARGGQAFAGIVPTTTLTVLDGIARPTEGDDDLTGTDEREEIDLGAGDDIFRALGGNDVITPGPGSDTVEGGDGDDIVILPRLDGALMTLGRVTDGTVFAIDGLDGSFDRLLSIENLLIEGRFVATASLPSFDPLDYIAANDDLARVLELNFELGELHFYSDGFREARPTDFDAAQYLANWGDLSAAFGNDLGAARLHFIVNGVNENRLAENPLDYIASFADLIGAFAGNDAPTLRDLGIAHYLNAGADEGRRAGIDFDAAQYLANWDDLRAAFGNDLDAAAVHYISFGHAEGRLFSDPLDYIASNPDLMTAFSGLDAAGLRGAGLVHYAVAGREEDRPTEGFDVSTYLANYADLRAAFPDGGYGYDDLAATLHWIGSGFAEGRTDDLLPI